MQNLNKQIKVIIFGASGMIGKGVLIECIESQQVLSILAVARSPIGIQHPKLITLMHKDFTDYSNIRDLLTGWDACFFCLGTSSLGMTENEYSVINYDYTIAAAEILLSLNPDMSFCYISATGADSSEKGRSMWARVKGKTENKIISMPFKASYIFRPGYIQPMKGVKSKVRIYRYMYYMVDWLYPLLKTLFRKYITTSVALGKAMINTVVFGYEKNILENHDMNILAVK